MESSYSNILKNNMLSLYYNNIDIQARKNKININIPLIQTVPVNIADTLVNTATENATETEHINTSDDFVYKKPWNKLNSIHKVIKMKEFINNMSIDDIEIKKHLQTMLIDTIKNRKLTKKNDVEYDNINGKILSIPTLQYKHNKYCVV